MSSKNHQCTNCQKIYSSSVPNDLFCTEKECDGIGLLLEIDEHHANGKKNEFTATKIYIQEKAFFIFLLDASASMFFKQAFPDTSFKSRYGNEFLSRGEVITNMCASTIFSLKNIDSFDALYICPILFDCHRTVLFTKSVSDIIKEYGSAANLAEFMFNKMSKMKREANISAALDTAYDFTNKFINGSIEQMGKYEPMQHLTPTFSGEVKEVYNTRTFIYTDGLAFESSIKSPFQNMETDLLVGILVGNEKDDGYKKLEKVIGNCPIHREKQLFIIDSPTKISMLGIISFSEGATGFCPKCKYTKPIPDHWN